MSTSNWIWSDPYQDYYYVTYDEYNQPVYHWLKHTEVRPRQDSGSQQNHASNVAQMPDPAPAQFRSLHGAIQGTPQTGWYDLLDSSYRMRTGSEAVTFFVSGRVFEMLYRETAGETISAGPNDDAYTVVRFNERVHTNIRRFVVVEDMHGFVYACGIGTYSGRGTLKSGINPAVHAIVYLSGTDPESCYLPGEREAGMTTEPIEVIPVDSSVRIRPESRIRLRKTYPIEKNVKVKDIGRVHPNHLGMLLEYWSNQSYESDVSRVRAKEWQQETGEARDIKRVQAGWSVSDDDSNQDELNAQEMSTQKGTAIQTGQESGDKSHFLDAKDFLDEEDLLDEGDVQDQDIDERPQSSASQSYTNEDNEPTKSENAETNIPNILTDFAPNKTQEELPNIMTRSNDTQGKVDATEVDNAVPRWLQDINYQFTGDLHSDYTVINNPRAFFKKGKVFMVPWPELSGNLVKGQAGPPVMVKIRRLVVIRPKATFCLCLPIHTYSGQATSKPGVAAQDHAPVVSEGGEVIYHENEAKLTKSPMYIKVEKSSTGPVSPMSRLNFAKVYTVEYNVKVRPIGRLIPDSVWRMEEYFMECLTPNTT
ncbi:hypothetical protein CC77DRAFT_287849 [Alternaria alternata]|uniref:DUF6590 domain-containing protein n=2 Tax=Alternaria alternata complex TaxID=187734 RepID=A0A177DDM6_ALTAL|nr:hypothetical protein CC77DRAFT_287849 [Alternaria alternata]OAG17351.1 hypothetical protein CC77DRAFT_287849 [Alternaria alternata]RYN95444.1 hypothetical protein AA0119_g8707 [Alternaria tenuissima]RYO10914.1 hypothetical protein AA0121_g10341 [Alternaria tenuissima]